MTTPQLMAYVATDALTGGMQADGCLPDFVNNQMYFLAEGTDTTNDGLRQFVGLTSGDESLNASLSTLGSAGVSSIGAGAALSYGGYLVFAESTANSPVIDVVKASTLTLANRFGTSSSSLAPSTSARILAPGSMAPVSCAGVDYVLTCALIGSGGSAGEVCLLSMPSMGVNNLGNITEAHIALCGPGIRGTNSINATAYVLGRSATTTAALGFYVVSVGTVLSGATMTKVGTVAPSAIDATWTHITGATGVVYDQTDGNVLIGVTTTDAVSNQNYIVKLNVTTAAVMWATAVNALDANGAANMPRSVIKNGTFYHLASGETLYTITTSTGAATSAVVSILNLSGGISEDIFNSITGYSDWVQSLTVPTYAGTYMGTEGHHSLSNQWARYFPGGPPPPPPPPPPPVVPGKVNTINRAWTYVQDGHTFYVLDLDTVGVFAFDTSTQMWNELQTNGTGFNMKNGIMWGQRVVGGDPATGDVWELDPGTVTDAGGLYEIDHIVTGGVATRGREHHTCDAVRLVASFGVVADSGATLNLRFSDDYGETWSAYYPITLTADSYFQDLAWRSLGSFRSPGRIFEFSDRGGLIRLDGADAYLNGFDDEEPGQAPPGRQ